MERSLDGGDAFDIDFIFIIDNSVHDGICQGIIISSKAFILAFFPELWAEDVDDLLRCLWISSKRFFDSDLLDLSNNPSSIISKSGFVYLERILTKFSSLRTASSSSNKSGSRTCLTVKWIFSCQGTVILEIWKPPFRIRKLSLIGFIRNSSLKSLCGALASFILVKIFVS